MYQSGTYKLLPHKCPEVSSCSITTGVKNNFPLLKKGGKTNRLFKNYRPKLLADALSKKNDHDPVLVINTTNKQAVAPFMVS